MAVDPELLAILVCPKTKGPLELIELKDSTRAALARMAKDVLHRANFHAHVCDDMQSLVAELSDGVGAIMLAEEVIGELPASELAAALALQPPWSDVPVLVLARPGADSRAISNAMDEFANVSRVTGPSMAGSMK